MAAASPRQTQEGEAAAVTEGPFMTDGPLTEVVSPFDERALDAPSQVTSGRAAP